MPCGDPSRRNFHFHRGPAYAAEFLGYDAAEAELALLPAKAAASFVGIRNPHAIAPLATGEAGLDIGCKAGTDLLLGARPYVRRPGSGGRGWATTFSTCSSELWET